jgi:hypothetical protein
MTCHCHWVPGPGGRAAWGGRLFSLSRLWNLDCPGLCSIGLIGVLVLYHCPVGLQYSDWTIRAAPPTLGTRSSQVDKINQTETHTNHSLKNEDHNYTSYFSASIRTCYFTHHNFKVFPAAWSALFEFFQQNFTETSDCWPPWPPSWTWIISYSSIGK